MSAFKLILRSLTFHARSHLGALLGAAIGSAVLVGALVVGDSVRESLRQMALVRLGKVELALASNDRFFRDALAEELAVAADVTRRRVAAPAESQLTSSVSIAPALQLSGTAAASDGSARASRVQVLGIDERFWTLARVKPNVGEMPSDGVVLNRALAEHLRVARGDALVIRVEKPSQLSRDAPLSPEEDSSVALRLSVHAMVDDEEFGRFSLQANQTAPFNAFVSLKDLQSRVGQEGRANLLLLGESGGGPPGRMPGSLAGWKPALHANELLRQTWQLADAELQLLTLPDGQSHELRSRRVFLDAPVSEIASRASPNASGILTYLVNELRVGDRKTPYSMVTAMGSLWRSRPSDTRSTVGGARPSTGAEAGNAPAEFELGRGPEHVDIAAAEDGRAPARRSGEGESVIPPEMRDDEILINEWLADDLQAKPGDELELTYFVVRSMRKPEEESARFKIRGIVPMTGQYADRTLMPDFPGLTDADNCRDWDTGFALNMDNIREKDEKYWDEFRGTPKAFVTLAAGQKMWSNRFGNLTSIRYPISTALEEITDKIRGQLHPAVVSLMFEPVREQALAAGAQSQDFGQLFLGFSFFLIAAALLLMSMMFQFGVERRASEVGTLLALGFTPRLVRRLFLLEGAGLAVAGAAIGVLGGIGYARAMLWGLSTIWRDAVGTSGLQYYANPATLGIGAVSGVLVATFTIWLALRKQARQPAHELLAEGAEEKALKMEPGGWKRSRSFAFGSGAILAALALAAFALFRSETNASGLFFGAGSLVLVGGMALAAAWLGTLASRGSRTGEAEQGSLLTGPQLGLQTMTLKQPQENAKNTEKSGFSLRSLRSFAATSVGHPTASSVETRSTSASKERPTSFGELGLRNAARRRKRSLATIGLLACGSFLIAAIGVFRLESEEGAAKRSSGTGGFAFIGETSLAVSHDLNSDSGRDFFGIDAEVVKGVQFVPFRVRDGEDASCLNLNRAQRPRVLGVRPELLQKRRAFTFAKVADGLPADAGWLLLKRSEQDDAVPAIGDHASIQWALGKKVGETLDYVDERGQTFKIRLVAAVANSILQDSLVIDEAEFVNRFPSESGYRMFLIDAPSNRLQEINAALSRGMQDAGLDLMRAADRLAAFNAVQNTYLNTFQVLGGLGLLLGSAGLAVVVLRNVMERRGELALLLAVGFRPAALKRLVLTEHGALLVAGLGLGICAAVIAVLPVVLTPGSEVPYVSLGLTLGAVLLNGTLWTWLATRLALRGRLLDALRNE